MILYSSDLRWADDVRFCLETRMPVYCAETDDPAVVKALIATRQYGCVVILGIGAGAEAVSRMESEGCRMCWVTLRRSAAAERCGCHHISWRDGNGMTTLMAKVQLMLTHKRGPKRRDAALIEVTA
jgi:hypothetical protein